MKKIILTFILLSNIEIYSLEEAKIFYGISQNTWLSPKEALLVNHAEKSLQLALKKKSKLNASTEFANDRRCNGIHGIIPFYHLINNLCAFEDVSHLHIGLFTGGSLISAIYYNEDYFKEKVGIDCFIGSTFKNVCNDYINLTDIKILQIDCFKFDRSIIESPINVYVYDADHSLEAHKNAFTYYNEVFAEAFIVVIDDWVRNVVRQGTFNAFKELGYTILFEGRIPHGKGLGAGQYIAVIRK